MSLKNFLFVLLVTLLGCSEPAANTNPQEHASSAALEIIVPPDEDGNFPPNLWVGCDRGREPHFQMSDLDEIVPLAGNDPGGVAEAIEPFLSSGEGEFWPQDNWLILRETEDRVLLVAPAEDGVSFMDVIRVDGEWDEPGAQGGGTCPLHYLTPEGLNRVDWRVDPDAPLDESATTLSIVVSEVDCASGQELGDRLRGPQVVMTADAVRIAFAAEPPPGDAFTCPSNPEATVIVELPEPLGDRVIIEGLALGVDLVDYLP